MHQNTEANTNNEAVRHISHEEVYAKMVPKNLTQEQKVNLQTFALTL